MAKAMHRLILMRHAQAEASAPSGGDEARPLSAAGRAEALCTQVRTLQSLQAALDYRFENAPLVARVSGLGSLPRGQIVEVDILGMDELSLDLECRFVDLVAEVDASDTPEE